jgi:hypothetical protein
VQERTSEPKEKQTEMDRMNLLFVGRGLRIVELKERTKKL